MRDKLAPGELEELDRLKIKLGVDRQRKARRSLQPQSVGRIAGDRRGYT